MKHSRTTRWIGTTFALTLLTVSASVAGVSRVLTFDNDTGQDVTDLHVEFKQACDPVAGADGNFGPFPNQAGGGTSKIDFDGGTVAAGGMAKIRFRTGSSKLTIKRWWWTDGPDPENDRVGRIHTSLLSAYPSWDQETILANETVTISARAWGDFNVDSFFDIAYQVQLPDGNVVPLAPIALDVPQGQECGLQALAIAPNLGPGVYTLLYESTNQDGELVEEGDATLEVLEQPCQPLPPDEEG